MICTCNGSMYLIEADEGFDQWKCIDCLRELTTLPMEDLE